VSTDPARKYVLDTNLFIRAFREPAANAELQRFHLLFAPFEFLSAVVAQELLSGTHTRADLRKLQRRVLNVFARRGRIVAPSARRMGTIGDRSGRPRTTRRAGAAPPFEGIWERRPLGAVVP